MVAYKTPRGFILHTGSYDWRTFPGSLTLFLSVARCLAVLSYLFMPYCGSVKLLCHYRSDPSDELFSSTTSEADWDHIIFFRAAVAAAAHWITELGGRVFELFPNSINPWQAFLSPSSSPTFLLFPDPLRLFCSPFWPNVSPLSDLVVIWFLSLVWHDSLELIYEWFLYN